MKRLVRTLLLFIILLAASIITITACGGNKAPGTNPTGAQRAFVFNSNPVGLRVTKGFGAASAALSSPFVVNAQSTTPGGGNFSGFCNAVNPPAGRAALVIYGLGLWTSGDCAVAGLPDSDVGVTIPQNGQIGNVSIDAVGTGTGADDGTVGISSTGSGQIQIDVIHADGTRTKTAISCTLGISSNAKVHCDDSSQPAHHTSVVAGDQVVARFWFNPGDSYRAIRVNLEYATPAF